MVQKNLIIVIAVAAVIVVAGVAAFFLLNQGGGENVPTYDTDFAGKPIEVADNLDNGIVAVGQDTFRWVTYFGLANKCVMVDQNDMTNYLGKAFMYNGRALVDIEGGNSATLAADDPARAYFTHANCSITSDDVRVILELKPSMVVVPASFYTDVPNEMAAIEKAGIKTVAIGYIYTFLQKDTFEVTDDLKKQIGVLSQALKQEKRGGELLDAFKYLTNDLKDLRSKITTTRTGYAGALAYNGAHGLDSSIAYHMPMALAGVDNILTGTVDYEGSGVKTYNAADIAQNMKSDTVLFIDASGYASNTTNESKGIAKLFQDHDAYIVIAYIWTGINLEDIFVQAYQIMNYVYGDSVLSESQFVEKVNKVYDLFFGTHYTNRNISVFKSYTVDLPASGTPIFEDINNFYMVAKKNPIHGEVTINSEGELSYN